MVEEDEAPTASLPTPPISQSKASDKVLSWASLLKSTYFTPASGFANPSVLPSPGSAGSRMRYSAPTDMPRLGVMLFWNSAPMLVSRPSGVLIVENDGRASSSATNGSSMARVAG